MADANLNPSKVKDFNAFKPAGDAVRPLESLMQLLGRLFGAPAGQAQGAVVPPRQPMLNAPVPQRVVDSYKQYGDK